MTGRVGVIVGQVGTPATLEVAEIRRYLSEFLSDRRMIDLPRWRWWPILHGIILRKRPAAVRDHCREIWTEAGSPLSVISQAQAVGLADRLGPDFQVELGLAYGAPGPVGALAALDDAGIDRIVILPMFPQFSTTTTASIYDAVMLPALGRQAGRAMPQKRYAPTIHAVPPFFDDPAYIDLLADNVRRPVVIAPGFTTDCLETLHELDIEGRELFADGGGDPAQYRALACLNDDPAFLDYFAAIIRANSGGLLPAAAMTATAASGVRASG